MAARDAVSSFSVRGPGIPSHERLGPACGWRGTSSERSPHVIEHSWARCLSAGVDPARPRGPLPASDAAFSRLLHRFRDVIDVSSPVMDQVRESLSESGTIMILTDPSGVILKTEGDPATVEAAAECSPRERCQLGGALLRHERDRHGLVPQGAGAGSRHRAFLCWSQAVVLRLRTAGDALRLHEASLPVEKSIDRGARRGSREGPAGPASASRAARFMWRGQIRFNGAPPPSWPAPTSCDGTYCSVLIRPHARISAEGSHRPSQRKTTA